MNRRHFTLQTAAALMVGALAACDQTPAQAAAPSVAKIPADQAYALHGRSSAETYLDAAKVLDGFFEVASEVVGKGDEKITLPGFLATGDLFAFPSHQEGFPLTLLEAMAVGLPVVASEIEGPIEMIKEGVNGRLVVAADHFDLDAKLGILLGAFSKTIEAEIEKELDELLAKGAKAPKARKK
mgnify:CR=1 FL=1